MVDTVECITINVKIFSGVTFLIAINFLTR